MDQLKNAVLNKKLNTEPKKFKNEQTLKEQAKNLLDKLKNKINNHIKTVKNKDSFKKYSVLKETNEKEEDKKVNMMKLGNDNNETLLKNKLNDRRIAMKESLDSKTQSSEESFEF